MKKKVIFSLIIFVILLLSVVFAGSYAQGLSKSEKLQIKNEILKQEVENNKITESQAEKIYRNIEENMAICNNDCNWNENCQSYQKYSNCMKQNGQCSEKNYNCGKNCSSKQNCNRKICGR